MAQLADSVDDHVRESYNLFLVSPQEVHGVWYKNHYFLYHPGILIFKGSNGWTLVVYPKSFGHLHTSWAPCLISGWSYKVEITLLILTANHHKDLGVAIHIALQLVATILDCHIVVDRGGPDFGEVFGIWHANRDPVRGFDRWVRVNLVVLEPQTGIRLV